jgi:hypothetical protein
MLSEELAVFDNLKGRLYLVGARRPGEPQAHARAVRRLDELVYRLRHSGRSYPDVLDPSLLEEPTSFRASRAMASSPPSEPSRNTSAPATCSRWCSASA